MALKSRVLKQITHEALATFMQDISNFDWSAGLTKTNSICAYPECIVHFADYYNKYFPYKKLTTWTIEILRRMFRP